MSKYNTALLIQAFIKFIESVSKFRFYETTRYYGITHPKTGKRMLGSITKDGKFDSTGVVEHMMPHMADVYRGFDLRQLTNKKTDTTFWMFEEDLFFLSPSQVLGILKKRLSAEELR